MAKKTAKTETQPTALESIALRLDDLHKETEQLGEDAVTKLIVRAAKSARRADKLRANRLKRVGGLVAKLKEQGLSAEEIVARLTEGGER